jgi:hypothetical protein
MHEYNTRSRQRIDFCWWCVFAAQPPVFLQLFSMHHRPFLYQAQSPARQFALPDLQSAQVNRGFEFTIASVKVRRSVIVENIRIKIP